MQKSDNLQYDMLGRWVAGTNDSSTMRQKLQVCVFFIISYKIICKNYFYLFSYYSRISHQTKYQFCFQKKAHHKSFLIEDFDSKLVSGIVLLRESFSFVLVLIADNSFNGKRRKNPSHFNGIRLARCSTSVLLFGCWLMNHVIYLKLRQNVKDWTNSQNDNFFLLKIQ